MDGRVHGTLLAALDCGQVVYVVAATTRPSMKARVLSAAQTFQQDATRHSHFFYLSRKKLKCGGTTQTHLLRAVRGLNKPPGPSSWKQSKLKPRWGGAGIRRCYSPASFKQGQDHHPLLHQLHQRATEERVEGKGNQWSAYSSTYYSFLPPHWRREKAGWSSLVIWLHLNSYFIISLEYFKVHLCICAHISITCRIWTQIQEWRVKRSFDLTDSRTWGRGDTQPQGTTQQRTRGHWDGFYKHRITRGWVTERRCGRLN